MKLSPQAMVSMVFLFQRSLQAAAMGEEENFLERASVLEFEQGEDGQLYCVNTPGVESMNPSKFEKTESGFLDIEDE